eukprot:TRINITY_DN5768_c0_g1_i1.p1 TRINITY_DN5768_c0_g1~~TRINITY_DN5768_c0_g1_i1.p1  ORF type:complete len:194 (-),score=36.70 TRINITY_DN5768_c0_g1_i1:274-834(-)
MGELIDRSPGWDWLEGEEPDTDDREAEERRRELDWRRLGSAFTTAGQREGIEAGRQETLQIGFNQGLRFQVPLTFRISMTVAAINALLADYQDKKKGKGAGEGLSDFDPTWIQVQSLLARATVLETSATPKPATQLEEIATKKEREETEQRTREGKLAEIQREIGAFFPDFVPALIGQADLFVSHN